MLLKPLIYPVLLQESVNETESENRKACGLSTSTSAYRTDECSAAMLKTSAVSFSSKENRLSSTNLIIALVIVL